MIEIICIQERLGEQWIAPSSVAAVNKDEEGEEKEGCAALEAINSLGGVIILLPTRCKVYRSEPQHFSGPVNVRTVHVVFAKEN